MKRIFILLHFLTPGFLFAQTAVRLVFSSPDIIEYAPSLSPDGKTLFFQSNLSGSFRIYQTQLQGQEWTKPVPLELSSTISLVGGPSGISENELFFASLTPDSDFDLFSALETPEGTWQLFNLGHTINSAKNENFPSVSFSGKRMFFVRQEAENCYKILISEKTHSGKWRHPRVLPGTINQSCVKAPHILPDNHTLVFSSPGPSGDFDLYFTRLNEKGDWDEPKPMTFANTPNDDLFACYFPNGEKMIYCSGNDLYEISIPSDFRLIPQLLVSGTVTNQESGVPVKASVSVFEKPSGKKISEFALEDSLSAFLTALAPGKSYRLEFQATGYESYKWEVISSDKKKTQEVQKDIELKPIKKEVIITVTDAESRKGLPVNIKITNLDTREEVTLTTTVGRDGKYAVALREGSKYTVEIRSSEGYAFSSTQFDVPITTERGATTTETLMIPVEVIPLKEGTEVRLRDVYFGFNSSELETSSQKELERLVELLRANPGIEIEIAAHTDDVGSSKFNQKLSEKRAKKIADYLTEKGIEKKRLKAKGYGKSQPVVPNDTEENRAKNRRVEFKVLRKS